MRKIACIFLLLTLLVFPNCTEEKNEIGRENNSTILPLGNVLDELLRLRDESVFGSREGMYPVESREILEDALNDLSSVILRVHAGETVSQQEMDAAIARSEASMEAFKATVRVEDLPVPAELYVDGIGGGGYIDFGFVPEYSKFGEPGDQQFTVELWFKLTELTGFGVIVSTFYEASARYGWMINYWNGHMRMAYAMNTYEPLIEPAAGFNRLNEWVHVAAVYNDNGVDGEMDGGQPVFAKFYINGNLASRHTKPAGKHYRENELSNVPMIGFAGYTSDLNRFRPMSGYMKDFHIWNSAKSEVEIRQIMHQEVEVTGSEEDLVCGWSFDVAPKDNSQIKDLTGQYNASLHGEFEWIEVEQ